MHHLPGRPELPSSALYPPRSAPAQAPIVPLGRSAIRAWGVLLVGCLDVQQLQAVLPVAGQSITFISENLQDISATHRSSALRRSVRAGLQQYAEPLLCAIKALQFDQSTLALIIFFPRTLANHWSPAAFLQAWLAAYNAATPEHTAHLAATMPPANGWQSPLPAEPSQPDQLEYWWNYLADIPALLNLPTQQPRTATPTFHAATLDFSLPPPLYLAVQALGKQEAIAIEDLMLAAFTALVMRSTGQHDIVVGVNTSTPAAPVATTTLSDTSSTLAVRSNLQPPPTFRHLIHHTQTVHRDVASHAGRSYELVAEQVFAERPFDHQLLFACNEETAAAADTAALQWCLLPISETTVYFDLLLDLHLTPTVASGTLAYNAERFDAATIQRFVTHFQSLLAGLMRHPDQPITTIAFLTPEELHQQLVAWNATTLPVPTACLHTLVAMQATRTPSAIAVSAPDGDLTYAALNARANQLAHYLRQMGAGPERPIAICLPRTRPMLIALLGILKSGSAYVPLDPAYPANRLAYSLHDSQSHLLVTERQLLSILPDMDTPTIFLDELDAILDQQPTSEPPELTTPQNLAYIIYTSGSTGRPKGVALEHHSAAALIAWAQTAFTPAELRGVLAATSYCFDLAIFEMFVPLSSGGTVILANNVLALPTLAARDQVTLINTVPSAISELQALGAIPATVQTINLAGEPLAGDVVQRLYQQATIRRIVNLYGPTEDTTYSTFATLDRADPRAPSIGRAIANSQAYILDNALHPVPIGVAGELFLAGSGLARGYLHRPDATAEKFLPDPFSTTAAGRLYRTGDIARWRPDGTIEFQGRVDHQVKIRGFRIELGEIEAILNTHPQIAQSLVVGREDFPGDKRLVAYVVAHTSIANSDLRAWLQASLPAYMLPADYVFLAAFPLTPNGKVDRRALPAPERSAHPGSHDHAALSPLAKQVALIWADILHVVSVDITDNFFALGGHSLLATRVVSRLRADTQINVPLLAIFEYPTIAQLVPYIMQLTDGVMPDQPIQPIPRDSQNLATVVTLIAQMSPEDIRSFLTNYAVLT